MRNFNSIMIFLFMIALIISCGPKQEKIERYMKDGIEVIVNHLEPYRIEGEPNTLHLEEEFTIDTEKDYVAERGLADIDNFDVDSMGNIYFIYNKSKENCIFKFDKNGNFVSAFGRRGRGPGELYGADMSINNRNEIIIQNIFQPKLIILNSDGILIHEIPKPLNLPTIKQMENDNYFTYKISWSAPGTGQGIWSVLNPDFEKIKVIEKEGIQGDGSKFAYERHVSYATEENIYIGKRSQPYEVWVYDSEGNLKRIIKKDYKPIKISDEYKKERFKARKEMEKKGRKPPPVKLYFPEYWPAFKKLYASDTGWLFVMTYETSSNLREFVYDIFSPDGIFIGKLNLNNYGGKYRSLPVKVKNNRIYCLREKESGYKELVVYKMKWE
ncbi:MAG: 6-bladed beta-propeller [Candidatus Aminicenantes bacterium]|nr:6-bladed beta-propeller [Candidatus Aminicenantes bacterium]